MKKKGILVKSGFSKKKKQHDISREDLARAMDNFKNAGGKIKVLKSPIKES